MAGFGARAGLGLGAITCFVVALAGALTLRTLQAGRDAAAAAAELAVVEADAPAGDSDVASIDDEADAEADTEAGVPV
jgi:hypothetical protein